MDNDVREFLSSIANEDETFENFIRNSEEVFGIEEYPLRSMKIEHVKEYVNFLDDLWNK